MHSELSKRVLYILLFVIIYSLKAHIVFASSLPNGSTISDIVSSESLSKYPYNVDYYKNLPAGAKIQDPTTEILDVSPFTTDALTLIPPPISLPDGVALSSDISDESVSKYPYNIDSYPWMPKGEKITISIQDAILPIYPYNVDYYENLPSGTKIDEPSAEVLEVTPFQLDTLSPILPAAIKDNISDITMPISSHSIDSNLDTKLPIGEQLNSIVSDEKPSIESLHIDSLGPSKLPSGDSLSASVSDIDTNLINPATDSLSPKLPSGESLNNAIGDESLNISSATIDSSPSAKLPSGSKISDIPSDDIVSILTSEIDESLQGKLPSGESLNNAIGDESLNISSATIDSSPSAKLPSGSKISDIPPDDIVSISTSEIDESLQGKLPSGESLNNTIGDENLPVSSSDIDDISNNELPIGVELSSQVKDEDLEVTSPDVDIFLPEGEEINDEVGDIALPISTSSIDADEAEEEYNPQPSIITPSVDTSFINEAPAQVNNNVTPNAPTSQEEVVRIVQQSTEAVAQSVQEISEIGLLSVVDSVQNIIEQRIGVVNFDIPDESFTLPEESFNLPNPALGVSSGDETSKPKNIWSKAFSNSTTQKSFEKVAGYKSKNQGVVLGADIFLLDRFTFGGSYSRSFLKSKINDSNDYLKTIFDIFSIYTSYNFSPKLIINTYWYSGRGKVTPRISSDSITITKSMKINSLRGSVDGKYIYNIKDWAIIPKIGMIYGEMKTKSVTDNTELGKIIFPASKITNVSTNYGGAIHKQLRYKKMIFTPNVHFNINRIIANRRRSGKIITTIGNNNFENISTVSNVRRTYNIGSNIDISQKNSSMKFNISYDHYFRKGFSSNTISASMNLEF